MNESQNNEAVAQQNKEASTSVLTDADLPIVSKAERDMLMDRRHVRVPVAKERRKELEPA